MTRDEIKQTAFPNYLPQRVGALTIGEPSLTWHQFQEESNGKLTLRIVKQDGTLTNPFLKDGNGEPVQFSDVTATATIKSSEALFNQADGTRL